MTTPGSCQSAEPISLATIRPSGAIMKVAGIPSVGKDRGDLLGPQESHAPILACEKPANHIGRLVGRNAHEFDVLAAEAGSRASSAIDGISGTHGPHQVAQMFRNTGLPLNREKDTGSVLEIERATNRRRPAGSSRNSRAGGVAADRRHCR